MTRVEQLVEQHFTMQLRDTCDRERIHQKKEVYRARNLQNKKKREEAMRYAMKLEMSACDRLDQINRNRRY